MMTAMINLKRSLDYPWGGGQGEKDCWLNPHSGHPAGTGLDAGRFQEKWK